MMLEQQQRPIRRCLGKRSFEESQPLVAQEAGMGWGPFVKRVERNDGGSFEYAHRLDETVPIVIGVSKGHSKWRAFVMVAEHEKHRSDDDPQRVCETFVRFDLAPMCKIAGDDHEFRIGVIAVDGFDRRAKPGARIERKQPLPERNEMRVRENNEFHGAPPLLWTP